MHKITEKQAAVLRWFETRPGPVIHLRAADICRDLQIGEHSMFPHVAALVKKGVLNRVGPARYVIAARDEERAR